MHDNRFEDTIFQDIYSAIIGQKIQPGTKLKEDVLCDIYGVTRARIRSVLACLSQVKVVDQIPNRSAIVAKPTLKEAKEVFHARRLVEGALIRVLAERSDPKCCATLDDQVKIEARARKSGSVSEAIIAGGSFHTLMADLSDRPILGEFLHELVNRTALISATFEHGEPEECEFTEHLALIDCIREGRADDAVELMDRHLEGIASRFNLSPPRPKNETIEAVLGNL